MKCPHCGLINPESAQRCDCGHDFEKGTIQKPNQGQESQENVGNQSSLKNVFRIGFIIAWVFVLSFIWPRITGQESFSLAMWVIGALLAPFWAGIGIYIAEQIEERYRTKGASNSAAESVDPRLAGIRGWLILPAIYLVGAAIATAVRLFGWLAQFSGVTGAGYAGPFALQILVLLGYLVITLYAASRFFAKKRNAPSAMIGFWIAVVVADGLIRVIGLAAGAEEFRVEPLLGNFINAAIWIAYFRLSKRVKATFVRNGNGTVDSRSDPEERDQDHHQVSAQTDSSRERSRTFAIASLSLGILSLPLWFALSYIHLLFFPAIWFPSYLTPIPFAILGIIFGVLHLRKRRSARILAFSGIACAVLALGIWSLVGYLAFVVPPTYIEELTRLGYEHSVIDNPMPVELFRAVGKPSAQWYYSGAVAPLGWYNNNQRGGIPIDIPLTGKEPTDPVAFDPGDSPFGFFMQLEGVYEWFSESTRNSDRQSHVKIFPMIVDGQEIPNSYLFCWEDYPLDTGPSNFVDFTDLIVRVDGVTPVIAKGDESAP